MKKIYFAGQDNFGNRGCEALIRSNVKLIRDFIPDAEFLVPSANVRADAAQWPDAERLGVQFVPSEPIQSKLRWWSRSKRIFNGLESKPPRLPLSKSTAEAIDGSDALIMTGGDIISLDYGLESLYYWMRICNQALDFGKPSALLAASIGPFTSKPQVEALVAGFLKKFHLITVRETATLKYMEQIGVKNVHYVADPAFCLDIQPAPQEPVSFFGQEPVLGLNVSPLIRKFRADAESKASLDRDVMQFVIKIVEDTGYKVLLIPHVDPLDGVQENSDYWYMSSLLEQIHKLKPEYRMRVSLVQRGLNTSETKDIIRRCHSFMGARTHATVAALSQRVPTTSIAYSVKAKGINKDLFGHTEYVLDTSKLSTDTLLAHFHSLNSSRTEIVSALDKRIPELQRLARKSAELFVLGTR